jgi:hypothetical protein
METRQSRAQRWAQEKEEEKEADTDASVVIVDAAAADRSVG